MNDELLESIRADLENIHDSLEDLQRVVRAMYFDVQAKMKIRDAVSEIVTSETPDECH